MATKLVNALLDRHGTPVSKRHSTLEMALGLNYQQVRRRQLLSGWEVEELAQLAAFFGESLMDLVAGEAEVAPNAVLLLGGLNLPCVAAVGAVGVVGRKDALVAIKDPAGDRGTSPRWLIVAQDQTDAISYEVKRVTFCPPKVALKRVAVFDERVEDADQVAKDLRESGYEAQSFYSVEELQRGGRTRAFDSYVIGWAKSFGELADFLQVLRDVDPACPIVVITDSLRGKQKTEADLGMLASRFRFLYYDKPAGLLRVRAALDFAFGQTDA